MRTFSKKLLLSLFVFQLFVFQALHAQSKKIHIGPQEHQFKRIIS